MEMVHFPCFRVQVQSAVTFGQESSSLVVKEPVMSVDEPAEVVGGALLAGQHLLILQ